jgi:hypothetical protein
VRQLRADCGAARGVLKWVHSSMNFLNKLFGKGNTGEKSAEADVEAAVATLSALYNDPEVISERGISITGSRANEVRSVGRRLHQIGGKDRPTARTVQLGRHESRTYLVQHARMAALGAWKDRFRWRPAVVGGVADESSGHDDGHRAVAGTAIPIMRPAMRPARGIACRDLQTRLASLTGWQTEPQEIAAGGEGRIRAHHRVLLDHVHIAEAALQASIGIDRRGPT